jgi:hypothetical protein
MDKMAVTTDRGAIDTEFQKGNVLNFDIPCGAGVRKFKRCGIEAATSLPQLNGRHCARIVP